MVARSILKHCMMPLPGTVFLYKDDTVPVGAVRQARQEPQDKAAEWDKHLLVMQVTNAMEKTLKFKVLVGTDNVSDTCDLRCQVHAPFFGYVQQSHPDALPNTRSDLESLPEKKGAIA